MLFNEVGINEMEMNEMKGVEHAVMMKWHRCCSFLSSRIFGGPIELSSCQSSQVHSGSRDGTRQRYIRPALKTGQRLKQWERSSKAQDCCAMDLLAP